MFKAKVFSFPGKGKQTGEEKGRPERIPGTVFVIPPERTLPGGKLNPDLMAPPGFEPDPNQRGIRAGPPQGAEKPPLSKVPSLR